MGAVEGYAASLCANRVVYPQLERLVRASLSSKEGNVSLRVRSLKVLRGVLQAAAAPPSDDAPSAGRAPRRSAGRGADAASADAASA